jgi:hypothetical protein
MLFKSLRLWLVLIPLLLTTSCAHVNCAFDTNTHPDPISLTSREGVFFGTNYSACFVRDGVITEENIPKCAYKYYHDKNKYR